jgi:hypothetical protein
MFGFLGNQDLLCEPQVKGTLDTCRKVLLKAFQGSSGPFIQMSEILFLQRICCRLISCLFGMNQNQRWDNITQTPHTIAWRIYSDNNELYRDLGGQAVQLTHPFSHPSLSYLKFSILYCLHLHTLQGNPIYVFLFWELCGLSPNFHIHVSVSNSYILRIGPHISLQQNKQIDPGNI